MRIAETMKGELLDSVWSLLENLQGVENKSAESVDPLPSGLICSQISNKKHSAPQAQGVSRYVWEDRSGTQQISWMGFGGPSDGVVSITA